MSDVKVMVMHQDSGWGWAIGYTLRYNDGCLGEGGNM